MINDFTLGYLLGIGMCVFIILFTYFLLSINTKCRIP